MTQPQLGLAVVVVEDEPLLTTMLEELLEELGCTVVASAASVAAGAKEIAKHSFDIAILDVHLRGEKAWPLADALRDAKRPFIIASGDSGDEIASRYPTATILNKPYEVDSLAVALREAMARRRSIGPAA